VNVSEVTARLVAEFDCCRHNETPSNVTKQTLETNTAIHTTAVKLTVKPTEVIN